MLLLRNGNHPGQRKGEDPVNAVAIMYVNSYLADLQSEADRNRTASLIERRSLRERLISGAASLRKTLGSDSGPVVPQLKNYPYGG